MNLPSPFADFPKSIKDGWNLGAEVDVKKLRSFESIVLAATGASAATAELLASLLAENSYPVQICKDYKLPGSVDSKTLLFAFSYSGETEEVLALSQDAYRAGAKMLVATSGGRLLRFAEQKGMPVIRLPAQITSKTAFPHLFFSVLAVLQKLGLIKEVAKEMPDLVKTLANPAWREKSPGIAAHLKGHTVLVYGSSTYRTAARFWRYQMLATTKKHSYAAAFPELDNEDLLGFENGNEEFRVIILRDEFEPGEIRRRITATKNLLHERGVKLLEIVLKGPSYVTKLSTAAYLGILVSYQLAELAGTNPDEGSFLQQFQQKLKKTM